LLNSRWTQFPAGSRCRVGSDQEPRARTLCRKASRAKARLLTVKTRQEVSGWVSSWILDGSHFIPIRMATIKIRK
jgi:hypothetical protein